VSALPWPLSVPVLSDGTVTLRAHTPADIDDMLQMANDPEMGRWTSVTQPHTREMSEDFAFQVIPRGWDEGTSRGWAIEARDDSGRPRFAGNVDVRGNVMTDVGYALHPWARGRGLMVRALRLAVDWALTEGGAEIVHWKAHVGNEASLRVAHRAGFTLHAPLPGALLEKGRTIDAWTGSIRFGDVPLPRTRWAESVVLEGQNVCLRPFRDQDVARIVEACSDPVTQQWLSGMPRHYTQATAEGYLADCTWHAALGAKATWAVADRHTDLLLGNLSIMDMQGLSPDSGEIGYWMHPDSRGRGVMKEAVMLAVDHAFDPDGLDRRRLSLYAASQNAASNAIARAAGFRHVGTQRQAERLGDDTIDDLQEYELLRRS